MKIYFYLIVFAIGAMLTACAQKEKSNVSDGVKIMAYYYAPRGNFNPDNLPLNKLTHIIYSFTEVIDNEMKFPDDSSAIKLKALVEQKNKFPELKVMIACGGWGGSGGFSEMARNEENRKKFVASVSEFLKEYRLDGLDIDWEYPGMAGIGNPYIPEDKENFTLLMRDLREAMDKIGEDQLLTCAVAGWEEFFNHIELVKVMQYADYINIMSYDLAGGHDPYTSHHTGLGWVKMEDIEGTPASSKITEEGDLTKPWSAERIISYCIDKGVSPSQIVIGGAFYGKGWTGVAPDNNGLYQLNRGQWRGQGSYATIREKYEDKNNFIRYWDPIARAPYLYNAADSIFISYDDTVSIRLKTRYAKDIGLGGIMFWQLGSDAKEEGLVDAIYSEKMKLH
jgi:chitinase